MFNTLFCVCNLFKSFLFSRYLTWKKTSGLKNFFAQLELQKKPNSSMFFIDKSFSFGLFKTISALMR